MCVCVCDAMNHSKAKVESVLRERQSIWKPARSDQLEDIQSKLCLIQLKEQNRVLWAASITYCSTKRWEEIREREGGFHGEMPPSEALSQF